MSRTGNWTGNYTVTHLSTNRARRWLTSLIEANALTTTPGHHRHDLHIYLLTNLANAAFHYVARQRNSQTPRQGERRGETWSETQSSSPRPLTGHVIKQQLSHHGRGVDETPGWLTRYSHPNISLPICSRCALTIKLSRALARSARSGQLSCRRRKSSVGAGCVRVCLSLCGRAAMIRWLWWLAAMSLLVVRPPPGAATITIYRVCMCSGRRRRSHEPEMTADRAVERLGLRAGETVARFGTRWEIECQ